ncbi:hypothetical protein ONZ45_g16078 [Pleurotus djamor]|nr:hypothetical protein ONZ45_g16078 [Pleurotus djamor]
MSSKRGRKRNDNLPPNRARDVQRAFRARRAAHLQALEQRVNDLEEENDCLRQALNLPPANRPPLGKGPTGKDKPKPLDGVRTTFDYSRDSSSADAESPTSTRTSSLSPSAITASVPSRSVQVMESASSWDQSLLLGDHHPDSHLSSAASPTYPLPPMTAPLPSKPFHYSGAYTHSSRHSISGPPLYTMPHHPFSSQDDRSISNGYGSSSSYLEHTREQPRQPDYTYHPSAYQSHDSSVNAENPPATAPAHSQTHHRDFSATLPYPHRRSQTEPHYSIGPGFSPMSQPMSSQNLDRAPSPLRLGENGIHSHPHTYPRQSTYAPDGRLEGLS